jgi:hypothetical protein
LFVIAKELHHLLNAMGGVNTSLWHMQHNNNNTNNMMEYQQHKQHKGEWQWWVPHNES